MPVCELRRIWSLSIISILVPPFIIRPAIIFVNVTHVEYLFCLRAFFTPKPSPIREVSFIHPFIFRSPIRGYGASPSTSDQKADQM